MLTLKLKRVPSASVVGIYDGRMPERALFCHPDAWDDLQAVLPRIVLSDLYRSPESSLRAMQSKTGVQPPGYSHHGFGGAFDVDIGASVKRGGFGGRTELDTFLTSKNFPMFWITPGQDAPRPRLKPFPLPYNRSIETWHHSHLPGVDLLGKRDTAGSAEGWILKRYGSGLNPDDAECQRMLAKLTLYAGKDDGIIGPISQAAFGVFQRGWKIETYAAKKGVKFKEGFPDAVTRRVLAFVSADREIT